TREARGGLDSKVILRDAATLDLTFNPDFSEVESDDPQVTVNKRFETFFPEKRPFFTENAAFFATPETLLFSRRIADPQLGVRLTAKTSGWALGLLATDDRQEGNAYPVDSPLAGRRTAATAVRIQREVGDESFVGLMATDREFSSTFNRLISADAR